MTTTGITRARDIAATDPDAAQAASLVEYQALVREVQALEPGDWALPTDCEGWVVRDMVAHLAGAAQDASDTRSMLRHQIGSARRASTGPLQHVDYLCRFQIDDRATLTDAQVSADLAEWATRAPRSLRRKPRLMRAIPLPSSAGLRRGATVGYFLDVIQTRDVWLHRIDLARATGKPRGTTTAEPVVVGQVMRDLALAWSGPAVLLTLTGPGGGTWQVGDGEPVGHVTDDAVAYLRLLSGRSDECRLSCEGNADAAKALRAARVAF